VVFSPKGATVIVEEQEIHLHPRSQDALVDLFSTAVNDWGKQVIFTTDSWDMLLLFISDIGRGEKRGKTHAIAKPENFNLIVFNRVGESIQIKNLDIKDMEFKNFRDYLRALSCYLRSPFFSRRTEVFLASYILGKYFFCRPS
jgi:predicted ATPase